MKYLFSSKFALLAFFYSHRNPYGRTGIEGRGSLGRFGPNHAADPIATRFVMRVFYPNTSH